MDELQQTGPGGREQVSDPVETDDPEISEPELQERAEPSATGRPEAAEPEAAEPEAAEPEAAIEPPTGEEPGAPRRRRRLTSAEARPILLAASLARRRRRLTSAAARSVLLAASLVAILLGALIGAGIGLEVASNVSATFRSEAIVVPANTNFPSGQFAVFAQAVFRTDAVLQPVVSTLNLGVTPSELRASGTLSAQEVPTGGALSVVALSRDPSLSRDLANTAAQSLVKAMEANNLGTISLFTTDSPGEMQPKPKIAYGIVGAVTGLVAALGLVLTTKAVLWLRSFLRASRERDPDET